MACLNPKRMAPYPKYHPKFGRYYPVSLNYLCENENGVDDTILASCGKCRGCLLDNSKDWATRMVLESQTQDHCYFITLTYRDEDLYKPVDANGAASLNKQHLSKFFKDFRRQADYHFGINDGIRYFICGEYGPKSFRPHYHIILYGFEFKDLEYMNCNFRGEPYFTSKFLEKIWKRGFVCIAPVSYESCAYTARYTLKKADGLDKLHFEELCVQPEYQLQSTRPGLGYDYFLQNYHYIIDEGSIVLPALSKDTPNVNRIPRYFVRKLEEIDPILFADYKEKSRQVAKLKQDARFDSFVSSIGNSILTPDRVDLYSSFWEREKRLFAVRERSLSDGMAKFLRTL